ncbi:hypothetical protein HDU76_000646 [Blyttiomyces sp. JEL0837]|nr:hypothetical protein HDU76_000646 [Blyttiomyces sp. JEL0837]
MHPRKAATIAAATTVVRNLTIPCQGAAAAANQFILPVEQSIIVVRCRKHRLVHGSAFHPYSTATTNATRHTLTHASRTSITQQTHYSTSSQDCNDDRRTESTISDESETANESNVHSRITCKSLLSTFHLRPSSSRSSSSTKEERVSRPSVFQSLMINNMVNVPPSNPPTPPKAPVKRPVNPNKARLERLISSIDPNIPLPLNLREQTSTTATTTGTDTTKSSSATTSTHDAYLTSAPDPTTTQSLIKVTPADLAKDPLIPLRLATETLRSLSIPYENPRFPKRSTSTHLIHTIYDPETPWRCMEYIQEFTNPTRSAYLKSKLTAQDYHSLLMVVLCTPHRLRNLRLRILRKWMRESPGRRAVMDVTTANQIASGVKRRYFYKERLNGALKWLREMRLDGNTPDEKTFAILINALGESDDLKGVMKLFVRCEKMVAARAEGNLGKGVGNEEDEEEDIESESASSSSNTSSEREIADFKARYKDELAKSSEISTTTTSSNELTSASKSVYPNAFVHATTIRAAGLNHRPESLLLAEELYLLTSTRGMGFDDVVFANMMEVYATHGKYDKVFSMFERFQEVTGAQRGDTVNLHDYDPKRKWMQRKEEGSRTDGVVIVDQQQEVNEGKMEKTKKDPNALKPNKLMLSTLIKSLALAGKLDEAVRVALAFRDLCKPVDKHRVRYGDKGLKEDEDDHMDNSCINSNDEPSPTNDKNNNPDDDTFYNFRRYNSPSWHSRNVLVTAIAKADRFDLLRIVFDRIHRYRQLDFPAMTEVLLAQQRRYRAILKRIESTPPHQKKIDILPSLRQTSWGAWQSFAKDKLPRDIAPRVYCEAINLAALIGYFDEGEKVYRQAWNAGFGVVREVVVAGKLLEDAKSKALEEAIRQKTMVKEKRWTAQRSGEANGE